jgi:hypothetical protein
VDRAGEIAILKSLLQYSETKTVGSPPDDRCKSASVPVQSHVIYGRNEPAFTHHHRSIRRALGLLDID